MQEEMEPDFKLSRASEQITREYDVRLYTGFQSTEAFNAIFDFLSPKTARMNHWKGDKQTSMEKSDRFDSMDATMSAFVGKRRPPRKLTLEQELLLVMTRLRLEYSVNTVHCNNISCTSFKYLSDYKYYCNVVSATNAYYIVKRNGNHQAHSDNANGL